MDELEEIRQRKLAEYQQRAGAHEQQAQQEAQARSQIDALERELRNFLTDDGWEQWNNAKLSNQNLAYTAAQTIIMAGRSGQLREKLDREGVKNILRTILQKTSREITIKGMTPLSSSEPEPKKESTPENEETQSSEKDEASKSTPENQSSTQDSPQEEVSSESIKDTSTND